MSADVSSENMPRAARAVQSLRTITSVASAIQLDKKRSRSKERPWRLAIRATWLLLGLLLCLFLAVILEIED